MILKGVSFIISYDFFDFLFSFEGCNLTGGFTAYAIATQVIETVISEVIIVSIY